MRDPHRWRTIGLGCLGLGALSLAWLWLGTGHSVGVRMALIFFGAVGVVFGGMQALFRHQDVRAKQVLAQGEDIIADFLAPFFALLPCSRTLSEFPLPMSALAGW